MKSNKLIIAAAGSGKTTLLIKEALKNSTGKVLITTYTQANEEEIRKKFIEINRYIPENIDIQTWFSFLLKHCVRPYQGYLLENEISGLLLVNDQSAKFSKETDIQRHYFTSTYKIYSDKISKFVCKCNEKGDGRVIDRLRRIYSHIFIDEVQDLAGYDLEFLKLLFKCESSTLLVGDPRQGTYSTNSTLKNKKFKKSQIVYFFENIPTEIEIDNTSLRTNYRCISPICDLSNKLFPALPCTQSGNIKTTDHDGVFLVKPQDTEKYLMKFKPTQLRDSIRTTVNENFKAMNFGESKGLSFDRVLIYPTKPFCTWLKNHLSELAPTSRSKFYVAITRARYSVGFVYDYEHSENIEGVTKYVL
jgi:DNA helicase II / ATP-dependent DNA helicase PcrA